MIPEQIDTSVSAGLTRESARLVRAERMVQAKPNPVAKATERGYLDGMIGLQKPEWITFELESHYNKGFHNAFRFREILNARGLQWQETVIEKTGSRWKWAIYCEGYCLAAGTATSESKAGLMAEVARTDPRRHVFPVVSDER